MNDFEQLDGLGIPSTLHRARVHVDPAHLEDEVDDGEYARPSTAGV